jgi:hypothetical protein
VQWAKEEALLMRDNEERRNAQELFYCQIAHLQGKSASSCSGSAHKEEVDGLLLCERHALEAKLEGQIECWGGMLFHIDLWSREASRQDREDVVGLLEVQRMEAISARQRARTDLDRLRSTDTSLATLGTLDSAEVLKRGRASLPPRGARPLFRGLRRHRRR